MRSPLPPKGSSVARTRRKTAAPVMSLVKSKMLHGKRMLITGIVQMAQVKAKGDVYSIHGLARKLGIPTNRVRQAVLRGEITAQGTKSGTRTRWAIPLKMAHRMAKIAEADHDRLWKNGTRTARLLTAMSKHADLSKYYMRPTRMPWLVRLLECSRATIAVGLILRTLAGMTMSDNKEQVESAFLVTVSQLAAACKTSVPSVKVALRELRNANLIESTKRGRAPSVFRVLDAAPPPPAKKSPSAKSRR